MKDYMKDWAEMNKRQIVEINENIIENFRYMKNEYSNFKPFSERVNEKKELFFKELDDLFYNCLSKTKNFNLLLSDKDFFSLIFLFIILLINLDAWSLVNFSSIENESKIFFKIFNISSVNLKSFINGIFGIILFDKFPVSILKCSLK